jgi:hypothetical protein
MFPRDVNKLRYNHQKVILHTIASLLIMSQCEDHVFQTSGSKGTYEKKTFSERYTTLSPARACFTSCSIDPRKHQKQTKEIAPLKSNPPQVQQVYTHCTPLPPPAIDWNNTSVAFGRYSAIFQFDTISVDPFRVASWEESAVSAASNGRISFA